MVVREGRHVTLTVKPDPDSTGVFANIGWKCSSLICEIRLVSCWPRLPISSLGSVSALRQARLSQRCDQPSYVRTLDPNSMICGDIGELQEATGNDSAGCVDQAPGWR